MEVYKTRSKECWKGSRSINIRWLIKEKPYTDENEIMCWHYSHGKGMYLKGVNLLSCIVQYEDISLPIGYEIVYKDVNLSAKAV